MIDILEKAKTSLVNTYFGYGIIESEKKSPERILNTDKENQEFQYKQVQITGKVPLERKEKFSLACMHLKA